MDATIINNANAVCHQEDRLFLLGDIGWKGINLADVKARLVCKNVFVVPGNHDKEDQLRRHFIVLPQCHTYVSADDYKIVLCHYAMRVWNKSHHGVVHLFGHSHGTLTPLPGAAAFDVGVDCWDYKPLSLQQVKAEMRLLTRDQKYVVDHHGR